MAKGASILAEIGAGLGAIGDVLAQLRKEQLQEALMRFNMEMQRERLRQEALRTQMAEEQHRRLLQKEEEEKARRETLSNVIRQQAPIIEQHLGIPADLLSSVLSYEPTTAIRTITELIPRRFVEERPHITTVGRTVLSISPRTGEVKELYRGPQEEDPVERQLRLMAAKEEIEPIAVYDKRTGQVITGNKALLKSDPTRFIPASAASMEMREPALPKWLERLSDPNYYNLWEEVARKPQTYAKILRVKEDELKEYYRYVQNLRKNKVKVVPEEDIPPELKEPEEVSQGAVILPMPPKPE